MENEPVGNLTKRADYIFLFLGSENAVKEFHRLPRCTYGIVSYPPREPRLHASFFFCLGFLLKGLP